MAITPQNEMTDPEPSMMSYTCNSSLWRWRQENPWKNSDWLAVVNIEETLFNTGGCPLSLHMCCDVCLHSYTNMHAHMYTPVRTQTCTHKLKSCKKSLIPDHQKYVLSRHRRVSVPDRNCLWSTNCPLAEWRKLKSWGITQLHVETVLVP